MKSFRRTCLKKGIKLHKGLAWLGGLALIIFASSGILHPIMAWTGPKAAEFFPPQGIFKPEHAAAIPRILKDNNIERAILVKLVPSRGGPLLQVTERQMRPRRYFDLNSGQELLYYDQQHAVWLAEHYAGLDKSLIKSLKFQTEFDDAYPRVNRLLPVYRVVFDTEDELTFYLYTELGALAQVTNEWKTSVQTIFRILHTWDWLTHIEPLRLGLMVTLLLCLLGLVVAGIFMLFMMKGRKMALKRKIHRYIAYLVWCPILLFVISGTYHLIYHSFDQGNTNLRLTNTNLRLSKSIDVSHSRFGNDAEWLSAYLDTPLNSISLMEGPDRQLIYRLGLPQDKHQKIITRAQRFSGVPIEKPAVYFNANSGEEAAIEDKTLAVYFAEQQTGLKANQITHMEPVHQFGPQYDFRNKRLPVWQIDFASDQQDRLFIDTATGILVDRAIATERYERYSFSFLHKWNFLRPFMGRVPRDSIIIFVLTLALVSTILGYLLLFRRKACV